MCRKHFLFSPPHPSKDLFTFQNEGLSVSGVKGNNGPTSQGYLHKHGVLVFQIHSPHQELFLQRQEIEARINHEQTVLSDVITWYLSEFFQGWKGGKERLEMCVLGIFFIPPFDGTFHQEVAKTPSL